MITRLYAIAAEAFSASIRQPIFVVLLLGTLLMTVLNVAISAFAFLDDNKLLVDLGLSTIFLSGILLSAFTAYGVVGREIENGTVLTVVSKPVPRSVWLLGKFAGVSAAVSVAVAIWSIAFLLSVRHKVLSTAIDMLDGPVLLFGLGAIALSILIATVCNYLYRWVFSSILTGSLFPLSVLGYFLVLLINKEWKVQSLSTDIDLQLWMALLMLWEAILLIIAFATAVSTRLGQLGTLGAVLICIMIGLSSDYLFGSHAQTNSWARLSYNLAPNFQIFWLSDAITQQNPVSPEYALMASSYAAIYTGGILLAGLALFHTREVR